MGPWARLVPPAEFEPPAPYSRSDGIMLAIALGPFIALWVVLFLIFPPGRQDFPFNDDWSFARGAFMFVGGRGLAYYHWSSMPLVGQWAWSAPFVWLLGESFATLRLSTLAAACLGLAACFDLMRGACRLSAPLASFAVACISMNPLFFALAGTYMTDVPALSFSLAALALYARAISSGRGGPLSVAAFFGILAVATRQTAIASPAAAGVMLLRERHLRRRLSWLAAVAAPILFGIVLHEWIMHRADVVPRESTNLSPFHLSYTAFASIHMLGLGVLPILLLEPRILVRKSFLALSGLLCLAAYGCNRIAPPKGLYPMVGNILSADGIFVFRTGMCGVPPVVMSYEVRLVLTALGCLGAAGLMVQVWRRRSASLWTHPLFLFSLIHTPLLMSLSYLFDRYVLVLLVGACCLACPLAPVSRGVRVAGVALLMAFGGISLALMHDWLAWNSARWELGRRAVERGVQPTDIEGGFEWDGWYAPRMSKEDRNRPQKGWTTRFNAQVFPDVEGRFALSFSVLPGSRIVDVEPYRLWLLPGQRFFFLLAPEVEDGG
jgi:hypothetical protein